MLRNGIDKVHKDCHPLSLYWLMLRCKEMKEVSIFRILKKKACCTTVLALTTSLLEILPLIVRPLTLILSWWAPLLASFELILKKLTSSTAFLCPGADDPDALDNTKPQALATKVHDCYAWVLCLQLLLHWCRADLKTWGAWRLTLGAVAQKSFVPPGLSILHQEFRSNITLACWHQSQQAVQKLMRLTSPLANNRLFCEQNTNAGLVCDMQNWIVLPFLN